jgi:hypothetical protein
MPAPVLATRKVTEPEARALLSDYATLMKHAFVCNTNTDSDNPFHWNVGSVSITAGMHIEYVVKFENCEGSLPMGDMEMKSLMMDSQIEIETVAE